MLTFDNNFAKLHNDFFSYVDASPLGSPQWVIKNNALGQMLGVDFNTDNNLLLKAFSGGDKLPGSEPLAMIYAGHQFGQYVTQLGDGRGLLIGQIQAEGTSWDLHLKGSGPTPYSRSGDGRAVLRSSIREYLCSEALFNLGIPSTRALCITAGELHVWRESHEQAAMLLRVAKSHIRFGSFEFFHYSNEHDRVKNLADYCIENYFPSLLNQNKNTRYSLFLSEVVKRTANMIAHWQSIGFAHGVMNTDNMSILGDTFDFGPFGFLDEYNENFICNHSDYTGRYAFNMQATIGLWNLNAFAHALSSLLNQQQISSALAEYEPQLRLTYNKLMHSKLGLKKELEGDEKLVNELLQIMAESKADYTCTFRQLASVQQNKKQHIFEDTFVNQERFNSWILAYQNRLKNEGITDNQRHTTMNKINPKFILRNYLAQQAIQDAEAGNYLTLETLAAILQDPFSEQPQHNNFANPPPEWGKHLEISCSS